jgi:hypothetical protein
VSRLEVAYPAELLQAGEHFTSGCNEAGEIRGLALSGRHFGITLAVIRPGLLEELEIYTHCLARCFVDSGAFSEVDFPKNSAPVVARPIEHATWIERLELAHRIALTFRGRAYVVAPDRVGCQTTTLERLGRYASHVAAIASTGAQVIVPVQKGAIPMSEMYRRACELLGLATAPIAGVPMKKDATTLEDLAELVASLPWYGARIHLLGLGPKSKYHRFEKAVALIKSIRPNATITSDSTQGIRGEVGRDNGRHGVPGEVFGGPRRMTIAQDEARAAGLRGDAVKQNALIGVGFLELDAERAAALAAGWFDVELFDTLEEARADFAEHMARKAAPELAREAA